MIQDVLMTDLYFMPDFEQMGIFLDLKKVSCFDQYNNPLFAKYPKT